MSELPRGWVKAIISDVYNVSRGGSPRPIKDFVTSDPDGLNWIRIADASAGGHRIQAAEQKIDRRGLNKTREVFPGDLLLSNSMSFGRPYITDIRGCIHDGWLVLGGPATSHIDAEFAYRCLSSPKVQRQFDEKASGTTVRNLNTDLVSSVHIDIPPLAEQKRIVAKLDALNAKSARARTELARIETLVSRYKQAVLSKAFSGELTTSQRSVPASRVEVRDLLSELSQGWSPKCEKISASSDEQWAVITTTAIQSFVFKPDENKILPADLLPREHLVIEEGDVLITRAGPRVRCGVCCYVDRTRPRLMLCDKAYRLRLKDQFDPKFFVFLINSPELLSRIEDMKTGGNDSGLNLTQERFTSLVVPMWPLDVQHEIVRRIESAFAKIDRLAKEAKRALEMVGRLDEAILAKAFRGELVPQDENDEPAEHLLARIRAEREAAPKGKRGRGAKG